MRLTVEMLHEFDREYGNNEGFTYKRFRDNGRPEYIMNRGLSGGNPGRSHLALAYLYGRFRALGASPLLSDAWVAVVKEAYARDRRQWNAWEHLGAESIPQSTRA